jgi:hypothetical protein
MKTTITMIGLRAAADLEIERENGLPEFVSGSVYHSTHEDGPCPEAEIGSFRIALDPGTDEFGALYEIGAAAASEIARRSLRKPAHVPS